MTFRINFFNIYRTLPSFGFHRAVSIGKQAPYRQLKQKPIGDYLLNLPVLSQKKPLGTITTATNEEKHEISLILTASQLTDQNILFLYLLSALSYNNRLAQEKNMI